MIVVFDSIALLPTSWRNEAAGSVRCFNPGLLRDNDGWILAYRVVIEPLNARRIAVCRLDERFGLVPGSQRPLTDQIRFRDSLGGVPQATTWFADPRLYRFGQRLFLYWNSGWHEPRNYQFLQELDPSTLLPVGSPREMVLRGERQKLEKNWALFEADGCYAVYSVNPHRVLRFSLDGEGAIEFEDASPSVPNPGGYAQVHGGLRGGAPPQRLGDHYYSFCHSIENGATGYEYLPAMYRFGATSPFVPTDMPTRPVPMAIPSSARRSLPKLNAAIGDVIYPAGAAYHEGQWIVSIGIDDERCAIVAVPHEVAVATVSAIRA